MGTAWNRCVCCTTPVLGARRHEPRVCSPSCATAAMFELVRLEDAVGHVPAGSTTLDAHAELVLRIAHAGELHRRSILLRAVGAWERSTAALAALPPPAMPAVAEPVAPAASTAAG